MLILQVDERPPPDNPETVFVDGVVHLDNPAQWVTMIFKGKENPRRVASGWTGDDPETGASVRLLDIDRGGQKRAIGMHPPWRVWPGNLALDFRINLRTAPSPVLKFSTAMRDLDPENYSGDGVVFIVLVKEGEEYQPIFSRFSKSSVWEPATIDLSEIRRERNHVARADLSRGRPRYHMRSVLLGGLTIYPSPPPRLTRPAPAFSPSISAPVARRRWKWANTVYATPVSSFPTEGKSVSYEGFDMQVGGYSLKDGWEIDAIRASQDANGVTIDHEFRADGKVVTARARLWAEKELFAWPFPCQVHFGIIEAIRASQDSPSARLPVPSSASSRDWEMSW